MSWEGLERRYARDPLVTDDDVHGYNTRWEWLNTSTGERFQCNDAITGAAVWVLSSGSNGIKPLTGVAAPTTSAPGYLGEVRYDTDGKCWMLRKIDGSTYSWERLFTDIVLTQTQYNAIVIKDPNARYMIVGA